MESTVVRDLVIEAHRNVARGLHAQAVDALAALPPAARGDALVLALLELAREGVNAGTLSARSRFRLATQLQRLGLLGDAAHAYREVLAEMPFAAEVHNNLGVVLQALGELTAAAESYERALRFKPDYVRALTNLGAVRVQLGDPAAARGYLERAVAVAPDHAEAWINLGAALRALGELQDAAAAYRRGLVLRPTETIAQVSLAYLLEQLGDAEGALAAADAAYRLAPADVGARVARAVMLGARGELAAAADLLDGIDSAAPLRPEVALTAAASLERIGRADLAAAVLVRAVGAATGHERLRLEAARACRAVRRFDDARAMVAPLLGPGAGAEPWSSLGYTLLADAAERRDQGRLVAAIDAFERVLEREPARLPERLSLALALTDRDRGAEARVHLEQVLAAQTPLAARASAAAALLEIVGMAIEPERYDALVDAIRATVESDAGSVPPLHVALRFDSPALIRAAARGYAASFGIVPAPRRAGTPAEGRRIRVGYLSQDFHDHPVAHAIAPVIEAHDRSRFEVFGIAIGSDDGSASARRVRGAFDALVEGATLESAELAARIGALGLDVLVDLGGLTANARPRMLARRPAPLQVGYLGYPLTTAMPWTDYLLADRYVIPEASSAWYDEPIAWLPDTFMPGEPVGAGGGMSASRAAEGLPDGAFVFCNFNLPQRLNPPVVDAWLRILARTPGSVLWLRDPGAEKGRSVRARAIAAGVDPARIVFARFVPARADHLARLALANLFLDSLPYNAHTTAREALGAGVPVLTQAGQSFAGRVAGSLLTSLGVVELITDSAEAFESRAVELAGDAAQLRRLRDALSAGRARSSAFSPARQARQLEAAYAQMQARAARGEAPESFSVVAP